MDGLGGRASRVPGAVESSRQRVRAVGVDVSDRTAGRAPDRESSRICDRHPRPRIYGAPVGEDLMTTDALPVDWQSPARWQHGAGTAALITSLASAERVLAGRVASPVAVPRRSARRLPMVLKSMNGSQS